MTQIAMTEIAAPLLAPFGRLLQLGDPFSVLSLASALACAVLLMRHSATGSLAARIETAVTKILPRGGVDCPSCRLDVKLFLANSVLFAAATTWFGFSESMWRLATHDGVSALVGARDPIGIGAGPSRVLATLAGLLAIELGYWFAHWLCHEIPLLWRFHELHHSATAMTPLTALRQHPVEIVLFAVVIGLSVGAAEELLAAVLGPGQLAISLFGDNVLLLSYILTFHHLRHSHLWMPLPDWLGYLMQSPAHHQLHHSREPAHQRRNLGFALTIFDRLFGTLAAPGSEPPSAFGTTGSSDGAASLWQAWVTPFRRRDAENAGQSGEGFPHPEAPAQPTSKDEGTRPRRTPSSPSSFEARFARSG